MSKVGGFEVIDERHASSESIMLSGRLGDLSWLNVGIFEGWTWYEWLTAFLVVSWFLALLCGAFALLKLVFGGRKRTLAKKLE